MKNICIGNISINKYQIDTQMLNITRPYQAFILKCSHMLPRVIQVNFILELSLSHKL